MKSVVMLVLLIGSFGCSPPPTTPADDDDASATDVSAPSYLALGDSYTIGESVEERMRFPVQLANLMRTRGADVTSPVIIAQTGWTTDELAAAMNEATRDGPYDLVTLLIGVNDQYRDRDLDEFRKGFSDLLRRSIELARGEPSRVIVISIPDWGATPFADGRDRGAISAEIDQFNDMKRRITEAAGARWIDITVMSRELSRHESMIAQDGLHPSGMMYSEWARRILPVALEAVR